MQFMSRHTRKSCAINRQLQMLLSIVNQMLRCLYFLFFEDIERRIAFSTFLPKPSQLVCAVMVWVTTTLLLTKIYTKPEYK